MITFTILTVIQGQHILYVSSKEFLRRKTKASRKQKQKIDNRIKIPVKQFTNPEKIKEIS
ncbi:MAG: hypothetical protein ABRQ23_01625 [Syntrophomonadaceae bacterium]